ncbi:hypothetical protein A2U01_0070724, partial [Trifolium medium]|nr:hypothetical protein [Trifolium medium]
MPADQNNDLSVEKDKVFNVDDFDSEERSAEKTPAPSIAKRLRNRSGKAVDTACEPAKTPKKWKKTPTSVNPIHYGPKKQWSKIVHLAEPNKKNLKRK